MASSSATFGQTPDIYGQVHPIETLELIQQKHIELIHEIEKILPENKKYAIVASEKCPNLITDTFMLMFLRCELFNCHLAAQRYVNYWEKRVSVFGIDRAFQPITIDHMRFEDILAGEAGFANVILSQPEDDNSRAILFLDPSKNTRKHYKREHMLRIIWYMLHVILNESEVTQKRGLILMVYPYYAQLSMFDRRLVQQNISSLQSCLPIRISAIHFVHPPAIFKIVLPIVSLFLSKSTKKRVHVHTGSQEHVLDILVTKHEMNVKYIPEDIGGEYILHPKSWLTDRQDAEICSQTNCTQNEK